MSDPPSSASSSAHAEAPVHRPRLNPVETLSQGCDTALERDWLSLVHRLGLRLPDAVSRDSAAGPARAHFVYREHGLLVFIDGPAQDDPVQRRKELDLHDELFSLGYTVMRFHHADDWEALLRATPGVFGTARAPLLTVELAPPPPSPAPAPPSVAGIPDLDLIPSRWHSLLQELAREHGVIVAAGDEFDDGKGRVLGRYVALLTRGAAHLYIIDDAYSDAATSEKALRARGEHALRLSADTATVSELSAKLTDLDRA